MDLKDVLQAVRSGWWLLVGAVLLAVAAAGVLTWTATPLYSSSTQLFVSTSSSTDTSTAYQGNLFSQQRVTSYAQLLTGEQLAARVVDELSLDLTPTEVAAKVTATAVPETVILDVTVTDTSPQRAQDIATSLGAQFTQQVTELETPEGATASTVKVTTVEPADHSETPVSPNPTRNLALGAVLGLLLGLGLALLRSRLDNTVKAPEDIRELTGVGVIGTVLEDPRLAEEHLVADLDEHSVSAEAYRSIRTNLQFLNVDNPPRVIVISSSIPGEGKSTLAVNLSAVLAQQGSRVMLIEADLRRPRITRYMGLISGAGLTNVLAGTAALHEVAQPWGDGKLTVLGAGPMPPNPSEMLGSAQMRALLEELRETHDFVVIDAPPLLPVTDAAVLSVLSDGCVVSTRFGETRREELAESTAVLQRIDAKLLGVVLNRVPQSTGTARGYGYGYSYEADPGRETTADTGNMAIPRPLRGRTRRRFETTSPLPAVRPGR
ncbi:polysaccharide biosynthesis tyrosine autokinase [Geodermatophilus sp. SYSU D01176]